MAGFYENPENLIPVLHHFLAIFSEGAKPLMIPLFRRADQTLDIQRTLNSPVYGEFPATEREHWMESCSE